jgi:hypothetical protein
MASFEETQKFCSNCQRHVLARRPGTNHILHLLMVLFTCGVWALVWAGQSVKFGGWRCSFCGGTQLR